MISLFSGSSSNALIKIGLGSSSVSKFISCKVSFTFGKESSNVVGANSNSLSCKLYSYFAELSHMNSAMLTIGFCIESFLSAQYSNNLFVIDQIVAAQSLSYWFELDITGLEVWDNRSIIVL